MAHRLGDILKEMRSGEAAVRLCKQLEIWNRIVDERVGKNTEALKIRNRTLYILTSSSAWAQELTYMRNIFIKRFNEEAGGEAVRNIVFRSK